MLPLRDKNVSGKVPYVTYIIMAINIICFLFFNVLTTKYRVDLFENFGIFPIRYSRHALASQFTIIEQIIPFFSYMFLHAGWLHIIGNMWTLYIFGDNVEDYLGHKGFALFYVVCGIMAGAFHLATNWHSPIPTIGASGAIAGVMGAYLLLYPHARVLVLVPIFFFVQIVEVPAYVFLGIWFLIQFFYGTVSIGSGAYAGGVAWWTHIGGFFVGLYIILLVRRFRYKMIPM